MYRVGLCETQLKVDVELFSEHTIEELIGESFQELHRVPLLDDLDRRDGQQQSGRPSCYQHCPV